MFDVAGRNEPLPSLPPPDVVEQRVRPGPEPPARVLTTRRARNNERLGAGYSGPLSRLCGGTYRGGDGCHLPCRFRSDHIPAERNTEVFFTRFADPCARMSEEES